MNIEDKVPKKPSGSIPLWPMIIAVFTTGFSTKNGLLTVIIAIGVYSLFCGVFWLIWLIRIYFYQTKIIAQLNTNYDSKANELNTKNERIDTLDSQNKELEKSNSNLRSQIKYITTNRDTLINMNEDLKDQNTELNENYQLLRMALFSAAIGDSHISNFIAKFTDNKEFIDGTKTISHSKNN